MTALLWSTFLFVGVFVFSSADQKIFTVGPGKKNVALTCRAPNKHREHVMWSRADLGDKYVLLYLDGHFDTDNQHPSFKNRVDLQDRQMKDGDVSLILKDVTIDDTGTYNCRVFMEKTDSQDHCSIKLTVVPPAQKIKTESGQKVTLPCRAPTNNIRHLEWNKADLNPQHVLLYHNDCLDLDNQHPSFNNRVDLQDGQMKDGDVSLILKDVTINDAGTYICLVNIEETRSRKNSTISSIYLRVFPKEKIIPAESGQDVTLTCRAPNNKIDVVKWSRADLKTENVFLYQNGQFVPDNQHPSFKNRVDLQDRQMKDGNVSLILKDVTIDDTGTYECHVVLRGTKRRKRDISTDPISIINLRVDPGQTGVSAGLIVGLVFPTLLLVAAVVIWICYKRKSTTNNPGDNQQLHTTPLNPSPSEQQNGVSAYTDTEVNHPETSRL